MASVLTALSHVMDGLRITQSSAKRRKSGDSIGVSTTWLVIITLRWERFRQTNTVWRVDADEQRRMVQNRLGVGNTGMEYRSVESYNPRNLVSALTICPNCHKQANWRRLSGQNHGAWTWIWQIRIISPPFASLFGSFPVADFRKQCT